MGRFGAPFSMKVKLTTRFYGVKDGDVYPQWFGSGDIVEGDLARAALDGGYGVKMKDTPDNKALGGAPENKFLGGSGDQLDQQNSRPRRKRAKSHTRSN